jgi:hypothetical protein
MSADQKIKEIEDRLRTLENLLQRLTEVLIAAPTKPPTQPSTQTPKPASTPQPQPASTAKPHISEAFNPALAKLLTFTQEGNYWIIRGKEFLQPEPFRETLDTVQTLGGEYVSAGKNSHFKVPLEKA